MKKAEKYSKKLGKKIIKLSDDIDEEIYIGLYDGILKIIEKGLTDFAEKEKESYLQRFRKYWNRFNARTFYITDEHIQKFKDEN